MWARIMIGILCACCVPVADGYAQNPLTIPPRFEDNSDAEIIMDSDNGPTDATRTALSVPADSGRDEVLEEILVVRENRWRLPDFGTDWRAREDARQEDEGRITADFLPLWDPEAEQPVRDLFAVNTEMQRVGFIELFRIRFGRR